MRNYRYIYTGNYRPTNIMSVTDKMFEKCIANINESYFVCHENQLEFAKNGSCGKALFAFEML